MSHASPFTRHIKGFRKGGKTCPCCRETQDKQKSRRMARHRQHYEDRVEVASTTNFYGKLAWREFA
jgi:hypothetical protein